MKLSFMLNQARNGELSAVSNKRYNDATIIAYLNMALIALYNRFQLGTEEAIVTLRPDIPKTIYSLSSADPDVQVGVDPMPEDDFKSIIAAFNEDGKEISINNDKDPFSIFTVSYNQIQIPLLDENTYVSVIYRRNPRLVEYVDDGTGKATEAEVDLPVQLLEPALHYIGYRAHGAINGEINAENSTHYTRYVAACQEIERHGLITPDDTVQPGVESKGFV